jgi:putative hemolysin
MTMPTPTVTTTRRVTRKTPATAAPAAAKAKAGNLAKRMAQPAPQPVVDADTRRTMIAEAAYYCAEKRGFVPGGELQDWLEAEAQIQARLGG